MPGIVGCITRQPREDARATVDQMVAALLHESFYGAGTWTDETMGVYLGWVTRKSPFSDRMPLQNETGDVALAFSGEEFPEPGLVQRLRGNGHVFDAKGPDYLVHLCEEDPRFPAGLNGLFHGLLVNRTERIAVLFNDRYGMHRVYYHETKDAFYFASEAKAILAVRPELRRMDPQGMGEFIACGAVLENRTLFEDIHVLPPASSWEFRNGSLHKRNSYFSPSEWEEQDPLDPESYYRELREVFTRNLPRYFRTDERIALSLTGGLDTRMIMAWHHPDPGTLPCYTFGGMLRDCEDVQIAREIARLCGQAHQTIRVTQDFLRQFHHYAERAVYLSDGCVDVGRAPDLYLNQRAREVAPIRMTGTYGGEILRGVGAFKPGQPQAALFCPEIVTEVRKAAVTFARHAGHPVSFSAFKQAPWCQYGILALEQTQLSVRSPYLDNDLVRTAFRAPASALRDNEVCLRLIADGNRSLLAVRTDRGLAGNRERISEVSLRILLEFLFKAEYAYDIGMPQWLARIERLLSPLSFERIFLGRHKIFHFRVWYRDALARYIQEELLDSRSLSRPYIERKAVEAVVRGHLTGIGNYTTEIHQLLTLELLNRLFFDSARSYSSQKKSLEFAAPSGDRSPGR